MEQTSPVHSPTSAPKRRRFEPTSLGLDEDFLLTDYARLKGCSCKIPQADLLKLLKAISTEPGREGNVGMDCSIVPLRHLEGDLVLVSTTDFFFPSVEDPYMQGQIGCANVLSDLYAMGIYRCDTMLMLLAASSDMDETERMVVTEAIMKGYTHTCRLAGAEVTGGQSVLNPWPLIGGVAMAVVPRDQMIAPDGVVPGDVLVLTKPLGTQLAVNLKQWLRRPSPLFNEIKDGITEAEIDELYANAAESMLHLNKVGAELMVKHGAHAATDITGFGLMGHAVNMSEAQRQPVTLELHTLVLLPHAQKAAKLMNDKYKLFEGRSAETSGGLLVALPSEAVAKAFIKDLAHNDGWQSWIVGEAKKRAPDSTDYAHITRNPHIIEAYCT